MRNPFANNPLTLNELVQWKQNPLINPKTGKLIKANGTTYQRINSIYNKNKKQVDLLINNLQTNQTNLVNIIDTANTNNLIKTKILNCVDDRDPISMNIYWSELNNEKQIKYPEENFSQLVFYMDSKNLLRCLEKETLTYLKTYNITTHPVTLEQLPLDIFNNLEVINLEQIQNFKTIEDIAFDVFQNFSKISIFINYEWFIELDKNKLLKLNYELKDFWLQNVNPSQRQLVSSNEILPKSNEILEGESQEQIQKYLLGEISKILSCEKDEIKYMCNYIILGALGIVIPKIKELYPDFSFAF